MTNEIKGEVAFSAGGQRYTLVYSVNALIEIESALSIGVNEIGKLFSDPQTLRLSTMRTVFRCGLVDHHPDVDDMTAGQVMTAVGMAEASALINRALAAAFPPAEAGKEPARPLEKPASLRPGSKSTAPGSKSALPLTHSGA